MVAVTCVLRLAVDCERREDWRARCSLRPVSRGLRDAVRRLSAVETRDSCIAKRVNIIHTVQREPTQQVLTSIQ